MPRFELVPLEQAIARSTTGRNAQIISEYVGYIEQLPPGQAGRLQPSDGESIAAVRRRLGSAAKLAGKNLVMKRSGEELYFWAQPEAPSTGGRRRGRPRRVRGS